MTVRLVVGCLLAAVLSACQGETVQRRECSLDAEICDAIVRQVGKRAGTASESPVTVVVPYGPDEVFEQGGDFSVFVAFATRDPAGPVSTWTATKLKSVTGALDTDWSVAKWNDALPAHLVAALRRAQGQPAPSLAGEPST